MVQAINSAFCYYENSLYRKKVSSRKLQAFGEL
jgi:hypothetical protein